MKRMLAAVVVVALALAGGCSAVERATRTRTAEAVELPEKGDPSREVDERLPRANDAFGWRLLREMPSRGNTLLSPFSVTSALAMTTNGAAGDTRKAMERTLGLDAMGMDAANAAYADLLARLQTDTPESKLTIANSLWLSEGEEFRQGFLATNRDYFAAESDTLKFGTAEANERIDAWVAERTRGMIPELFGTAEPLPADTVLVLVNALYFKADWKDAFEPDRTQEETFVASGGSETVRMMKRTGGYGFLDDPGFNAVRLPYEDGRRAMYVFVPKDPMYATTPEAQLARFLTRLDSPTWEGWMASFEETEVMVGLPKMRLKAHVNLDDPLVRLGMGPAFAGGLSGIVEDPRSADLRISKVVHAVTVDVDETGTEASGATGVVVPKAAIAEAPPRVYADRPFFFAIRDEASGLVLFAGMVRDPTP